LQLKELRRDLHQLLKTEDGGRITNPDLSLVMFIMSAIGIVLALALALSTYLFPFHPFLSLFLAFFTGSISFVHLMVIQHECAHTNWTGKKSVDSFIGNFLSLFTANPFAKFRMNHLKHHAEIDSGRHEWHQRPSVRTMILNLFIFLSGHHIFVRFFGKYTSMVLVSLSWISIVVLLLISKFNATNPSIPHPLIIAVMFYYGALTLGYWLRHTRSQFEHYLDLHQTQITATFRYNLLDWAVFNPYGMRFHVEHHLVPMVPALNLSQVKTNPAASRIVDLCIKNEGGCSVDRVLHHV
jgi:fatty acid desaturase